MVPNRSLNLLVIAAVVTFSAIGTADAARRGHGPSLKRVEVTPHEVVGGSAASVTGIVTLSDVAPSGGETVILTSEDTDVATVPATVTVPEGSTSATFSVATLQVFDHRHVGIVGQLDHKHKEAELRVRPFDVTDFIFNPAVIHEGTILGGLQTTTGTVTISAPAGPNGVVVKLTSDSAGTTAPTLTVPAGATSVSFGLIPEGVTVTTIVRFVASIGCSRRHATLTLIPPGG